MKKLEIAAIIDTLIRVSTGFGVSKNLKKQAQTKIEALIKKL